MDAKLDHAKWGDLKGEELQKVVDSAFLEVARWKRNIFMLPTGKVGEDFIEEVTTLFKHFNDSSPFESISFTLISIIMPLLLQKPTKNSKSKEHVRYLEKRLYLWRKGHLEELLEEGRTIQSNFEKGYSDHKRDLNGHKRYIKLMENGRKWEHLLAENIKLDKNFR